MNGEPRTERERAAGYFDVPVSEVTPKMIESLPPPWLALRISMGRLEDAVERLEKALAQCGCSIDKR